MAGDSRGINVENLKNMLHTHGLADLCEYWYFCTIDPKE